MCLNKLHDRPWPGATPALAWWWLSREISRRPWLRILFPGVERSHEQISQNLTPSKKIKKWRDKLQDQSITQMESITISARVSLQRSESCSNGRMDTEWSWRSHGVFWVRSRLGQLKDLAQPEWSPGSPGSLALSVSSNFRMIPNRLGVRFTEIWPRDSVFLAPFWSKMPPNHLRSLLDAERFL